jgi:hypothetical protein
VIRGCDFHAPSAPFLSSNSYLLNLKVEIFSFQLFNSSVLARSEGVRLSEGVWKARLEGRGRSEGASKARLKVRTGVRVLRK